MQIKNSRYSKRKLLIFGLALLALLLISGTYGYFRWSKISTPLDPSSDYNKVDYNPPTDDQKQAGQDIKSNSVNSSGKPPAPGTDGDTQPHLGGNTIQVTITAANQDDGVFRVRTLIEPMVGSGACTLTLTKGSTVVTKTSDIQALANSSTCKGFDIPTSELSAGAWHIQLTVSSGGKTDTASKDITIQ